MTVPEQAVEAALMRACDFVPGAQVKVVKGSSCLRKGAVHTVTTDSVGTPCIRCQFDGQEHAGWHYPLGTIKKKTGDDLLEDIALERAALPLVGVQRREDVARDLIQEVLDRTGSGFSRESAETFTLLPYALAESGWFKRAEAFLALPHTGQQQNHKEASMPIGLTPTATSSCGK